MDRSLSLALNGEEFVFDCRRGIFWPRMKMFICADLHWGKTQYLRNHGIAISDNILTEDLRRLGSVITDYQVESIVVLGDLIHHEHALTHGIIEKIAHFRHEFPCELLLVKGNHDRYTKFPESWGIVEETSLTHKGFSFHHELQKKDKNFQFAGHVHPMIRLRAGHDFMRLPTFVFSPTYCLLPAFSHFTGGQDVKLSENEKAVVIADDGVSLLD